jgi:hypothetical protein
LLKIDVEGMEAAVLKGGTQTLIRCTPALYFECERTTPDPAIIEPLSELGYRFWRHDPPAFNAANWRGEGSDIFGGVYSHNVLALPKDRAPPRNAMLRSL